MDQSHIDRLEDLTAGLRDAREAESAARDAMAEAVQEATAAGMSQYRIVQVTGLARATVAKWASGQR